MQVLEAWMSMNANLGGIGRGVVMPGPVPVIQTAAVQGLDYGDKPGNDEGRHPFPIASTLGRALADADVRYFGILRS